MKKLSESEVLRQFLKKRPDSNEIDTDPSPSNIETFPSSPIDMPLDTFEKGIRRRQKNRQVLVQWIEENLVPQIDFGSIHLVESCPHVRSGSPDLCKDPTHWTNPVLWKSGAEKILGVLGLTVHFPNLNQFEMAAAHKQELNQIVLKCQLKTHTGVVICEGVGARSIEQDNYNLNKAIKMAARGAMIDATLRTTGLTNVFGQSDSTSKHIPHSAGCNSRDNETSRIGFVRQSAPEVKYITQRQKNFILKLSGRLGWTTDALNKRCFCSFNSDLTHLKRHQASRLIQQLNKRF